jgi:uncharacterized protein YlaN (UPF0358 family)
VSDLQLMEEALRRLSSTSLRELAMTKRCQELQLVFGKCPTARQILDQQMWERSTDAGR